MLDVNCRRLYPLQMRLPSLWTNTAAKLHSRFSKDMRLNVCTAITLLTSCRSNQLCAFEIKQAPQECVRFSAVKAQ